MNEFKLARKMSKALGEHASVRRGEDGGIVINGRIDVYPESWEQGPHTKEVKRWAVTCTTRHARDDDFDETILGHFENGVAAVRRAFVALAEERVDAAIKTAVGAECDR